MRAINLSAVVINLIQGEHTIQDQREYQHSVMSTCFGLLKYFIGVSPIFGASLYQPKQVQLIPVKGSP